ncbi:Transmembrane protein 267 [Amphibalanus amphitrite]|uniref:Transmembrane protein 267 n=1 Tax=Amphibalanus amphitrite TaxID=1232801 RepID=A0A6A4WIK4_AMPAM|nr:transmembrane protein 267-like [Amphibalanus amphitrite]XP_043213102.1 transmembrane protein 267-like [Amphibalanus amphitrite]XP_043213108.1 transmembrane protein 267-like [Amphibalanus amphitrite]XP_043213117.1 transmembrane protein 267-like [Amphibalanus amphitrite]XP_043213123.1 transmembrane protein 267-like [Amphibalanus amphitrite]XP_043213127.1 transmembrane protein 267-like [Amphibalanus amphitrite]KAF0305923.1 Transmembrane protein 267 [Amphibalanus amphitrite]
MLSVLTDSPVAPLVLLVLTCCVGDLALHLTAAAGPCWPRAVLDTATHGLVALFTWTAVTWSTVSWRLAALAGFCGAVIDLDHALMAGSLNIEALVSLPSRPPLHATSPWLLLLIPLAVGGRVWRTGAALLLAAGLSHHLRDAGRRGLLLPPLGSTPPLPTPIYLTLEVVLCLGLRHALGSATVPAAGRTVLDAARLLSV